MTKEIKNEEVVVPKRGADTKNVRNKSGHRIELVINNEVVVFYPGQMVKVPIDFRIPDGLGLYVR